MDVVGHFNPRAPRGARLYHGGATDADGADFNPRAPRGARPYPFVFDTLFPEFQSTRPARGATEMPYEYAQIGAFQSTRPARGATTSAGPHPWEHRVISIHAPREGRDKQPP